MRKRLKLIRVRLAMFGSCQCYLGLSSGLRWIFFAFFYHSDPTKVWIGERNPTDHEVKLLKMTEGCTVLLNPSVTAASGDSGDSIDKMFDEGNFEGRPPIFTSPTGGKSLSALRGMVLEGSAIPSDATEPLVTASVTPMSDVGPVDFVFGLNLRTRPPHVAAVAVTTTVDANVATCSIAKDAAKDFEHIGDFASAGGVDADAANISKLKKPFISSDSFYASQSLDTEIMHRLRAMEFDQLYSKFNIEAAWQVCLGAEVRMRAEHTLERKSELEDRSEAGEAISLRSQLSVVEAADVAKGTELSDLKEKNFALEGEKNVLSERVEALESMATSKEVELESFSSQVVNLTADLSGFPLSRDELNSKKNSLESAFELFKEQVEKMQDEQVGVLSDRVAAIDSELMEMLLYMDTKFYPRYLTTIGRRGSILSRGLRLILTKCLSSLEYLSAMGDAIGCVIDKGMQDGLEAGIEHGIAERSITDVAAFNLSARVIILLLSMPFKVIIGETSLAFSLEVAHNRVQRLRGDATARRLSLMDSILSLVEPLSARNLTVPATLSTEVPPSPKVVFEEEELDTAPEHVSAP
nr:hypothetical protein [Tanacetum cinerariifolium]